MSFKVLITLGIALMLLIVLAFSGVYYAPLYAYIIICAAIIGIAAYFLAYKLYLNAALKNENHRRMPSLYQVVIVILGVAGVAGLINMSSQISDLQNQVSSLNYNIYRLQIDMESLYGQLSEWQEQQESLVSSIDWDYGPYDAEHQTADIIFMVVPKSVTDQPEITLSFGGTQINLTENSAGIYTGRLSLDIFRNIEDEAILTIEQDGVKQTQAINDLYINEIWRYYLPYIYINASAVIDDTEDGETKTWDVSVGCAPSEYDSSYTVETFHMITVLNGTVISDEDLLTKPAEGSLGEGLSIEFQKQQTYKYTDDLQIYVEAKDRNGLTYRQLLYRWEEEMEYIYMNMPDIFDDDGKQLLKNAF